jgi:hypothetical protein
MFFRRFRLSAGHLKKVLPSFSTAQDSTSSLIAARVNALCVNALFSPRMFQGSDDSSLRSFASSSLIMQALMAVQAVEVGFLYPPFGNLLLVGLDPTVVLPGHLD